MKTTIIFSFLLLFISNLMSQTPVWTGGTSPNRLFPSQTDTKVGIGTNSPYNQAWSQLTIQNSNTNGAAGFNMITNNQNWEIQNVNNGPYLRSLIVFNRTNSLYALTITPTGNIGIGLPTSSIPSEKLEVNGHIKVTNGRVTVDGRIISNYGHIEAHNGHYQLGNDYHKWGFYTEHWDQTSQKLFISPSINQSGTWGWNYGRELVLDGDGSMVKKIMTTNIKAFSIYVHELGRDVFRIMGDGKVYATEINVKLSQNFPDYVFSEDYKLISLKETQDFISQNGHLPGIPSAKEIEENGNTINIGEMQILLLKKIEELTLHLIDLKSENDKLKEIIETSGLKEH